jgi:hypothetical protein
MNLVRAGAISIAMLVLALVATARADEPASPPAADAAAYERLKSLAGLWTGRVQDAGAADVQVRYEVSSSGQAVIEHLFSGQPHEMVTVYFLASGRLEATHYCSIGNQPTFRLAAGSTPDDIRMKFAGGTGFDPQTDQHAHGVEIRTRDADRVEVEWYFQKGTQPAGSKRMLLERVPGAA